MLFRNLVMIQADYETGLYEIQEYNFLYQIDPAVYKSLRAFFRKYEIGLIAEWYDTPTDEEKKFVTILDNKIS